MIIYGSGIVRRYSEAAQHKRNGAFVWIANYGYGFQLYCLEAEMQKYYVIRRSQYGPQVVAGPFDTRDRAQAWIDSQPQVYRDGCSISN
jgi:hypothetical protein